METQEVITSDGLQQAQSQLENLYTVGRTDVVSLGSVVHLRNSDDREYQYRIVGAYEAQPSSGRISNESPVGKALLGHKIGDLVLVSTPGGVKEYTILTIE